MSHNNQPLNPSGSGEWLSCTNVQEIRSSDSSPNQPPQPQIPQNAIQGVNHPLPPLVNKTTRVVLLHPSQQPPRYIKSLGTNISGNPPPPPPKK